MLTYADMCMLTYDQTMLERGVDDIIYIIYNIDTHTYYIYIYIHTYIHTYIYTHTHIYIYIYTHTHT
jgi:hypothetical protein